MAEFETENFKMNQTVEDFIMMGDETKIFPSSATI